MSPDVPVILINSFLRAMRKPFKFKRRRWIGWSPAIEFITSWLCWLLVSSLISVTIPHYWITRASAAGTHINDHVDQIYMQQSAKDPMVRIFFLILIHNQVTLDHVVDALLPAICHPNHVAVIHMDRKAAHLLDQDPVVSELRQQQKEQNGGNYSTTPCRVVRMEAVHSVEWSAWSMNLPTLWGMEIAQNEYYGQWDVWINLSGDNWPVYTPHTMATLLAALPYNFVTSSSCETALWPTPVYHFPRFWHKRRHYTRDETESDPVFTYRDSRGHEYNQTVVAHFGSQWMILQADFVRHVVQELKRSDSLTSQLSTYLETSGKLMTDETFFPTLIMHTNFRDTLPHVDPKTGVVIIEELFRATNQHHGILDIRYERMDEHFPSATGIFPSKQHYDVPNEASTILTKPRIWGPYYLGVYDLADIRDSGALWIRKVSAHVDPNLLWILPVNRASEIPAIQWPNEVALTAKPDWDAFFEQKMAAIQGIENEQKDDDPETDKEL